MFDSVALFIFLHCFLWFVFLEMIPFGCKVSDDFRLSGSIWDHGVAASSPEG